jgi:hypothetical protein
MGIETQHFADSVPTVGGNGNALVSAEGFMFDQRLHDPKPDKTRAVEKLPAGEADFNELEIPD